MSSAVNYRIKRCELALMTEITKHEAKYHNKNMLLFLINLYEKSLVEKTSLFDSRINLSKYNCKCSTKDDCISVHIVTNVVNSKKELMLEKLEISMELGNKDLKVNYLKKVLKNLIFCAFNGYLTNPIEKDELFVSNNKLFNRAFISTYECETCHKQFDNAKEFLQHLVDEQHQDSIYTQFGFWGGKFKRYVAK